MKIEIGKKIDQKAYKDLLGKTACTCAIEDKCQIEVNKNRDGSLTYKSPRSKNILTKFCKKKVETL
ncbi:MAG: hypothetical protein KGD63_07165 [Candidatus Lokiarchaeota archaeon]|nr:hypothetical protein [Candidatus Lokiarchaeota archaeon]